MRIFSLFCESSRPKSEAKAKRKRSESEISQFLRSAIFRNKANSHCEFGPLAEVEQEISKIFPSVPNEREEKHDREEAQAQEQEISNYDRASADISSKSDNDDDIAQFSRNEEKSKDEKDHKDNAHDDDFEDKNDQIKESKLSEDVKQLIEDDRIIQEQVDDEDASKNSEKSEGESEKENDEAADAVMDDRVEDHKIENNKITIDDSEKVNHETSNHSESESDSSTGKEGQVNAQSILPSANEIEQDKEITPEENIPEIESSTQMDVTGFEDNFDPAVHVRAAQRDESEVRELKYQLERAERRCSLSDKVSRIENPSLLTNL